MCKADFLREMDCPVQWSLATPSALETQYRANQGSVVANPICMCRYHKASHLEVRVAVGRRSTCVLTEAPSNKGPLRLPHSFQGIPHIGNGPNTVSESTVLTPSSVSLLALNEFWGESSASSFRPTICVSE